MQQKRVSFKRRAESALFFSLISLVAHLPRGAQGQGKRALVFFFKRCSPRHSRLVSRNLALAFPAATPSWREDLKDRIYSHFGGMFMEIARTFTRKNPRSILERTRIDHIEFLERALGKKRGVIVFSAHFGNWEWIPLILSDRLQRPIHSIARSMDNPLVEARVREFREAMGSRIIYKQGSLRTILKRLGENGVVYLLIDQNTVPREGIFVDFFAHKAAAVTTVSQLYLKKGVPVVPVFLHYEDGEIVLNVLPEIDQPVDADSPTALTELTQHLTGLIEEQVRRFPEQWFWFHDRWKTRPEGET